MKDLLTIEQAAQEMGVCSMTIRRWIASGRLDAIRIGPRNIRVKGNALKELLQPLEKRKPKRIDAQKSYSVTEAADTLGILPRAIIGAIARESLPAIRSQNGRAWKIAGNDLVAYNQKRKGKKAD